MNVLKMDATCGRKREISFCLVHVKTNVGGIDSNIKEIFLKTLRPITLYVTRLVGVESSVSASFRLVQLLTRLVLLETEHGWKGAMDVRVSFLEYDGGLSVFLLLTLFWPGEERDLQIHNTGNKYGVMQ